jgi:guanylate kinase
MELSLRSGKFYVTIAGPSGGGKSTLCKMLINRYHNVVHSVSNTTRKKREGEQEGVHYFFLGREQFQKIIDDGGMVEWAEVHGNYYGTSRDFLEGAVKQGKIVVLDIDVQGVESFKRLYPDETLSVFLLPPSMEVLETRLRSRGTDSNEVIEKRLRNAREEISHASEFDYTIVNNDLDDAFIEFCEILEKELGV